MSDDELVTSRSTMNSTRLQSVWKAVDPKIIEGIDDNCIRAEKRAARRSSKEDQKRKSRSEADIVANSDDQRNNETSHMSVVIDDNARASEAPHTAARTLQTPPLTTQFLYNPSDLPSTVRAGMMTSSQSTSTPIPMTRLDYTVPAHLPSTSSMCTLPPQTFSISASHAIPQGRVQQLAIMAAPTSSPLSASLESSTRSQRTATVQKQPIFEINDRKMPITTTNDATNYNDSLLRNTNYAPPPNHDRTTPQHPHPSTGDKHTRLGSSTSMSNISTFSSNARTNETCAMDWQEGDNMNDNFQMLNDLPIGEDVSRTRSNDHSTDDIMEDTVYEDHNTTTTTISSGAKINVNRTIFVPLIKFVEWKTLSVCANREIEKELKNKYVSLLENKPSLVGEMLTGSYCPAVVMGQTDANKLVTYTEDKKVYLDKQGSFDQVSGLLLEGNHRLAAIAEINKRTEKPTQWDHAYKNTLIELRVLRIDNPRHELELSNFLINADQNWTTHSRATAAQLLAQSAIEQMYYEVKEGSALTIAQKVRIAALTIDAMKTVDNVTSNFYCKSRELGYRCKVDHRMEWELAYTIANSYGNEVKEWLCRCLLRHRGLRGVDRSFCERIYGSFQCHGYVRDQAKKQLTMIEKKITDLHSDMSGRDVQRELTAFKNEIKRIAPDPITGGRKHNGSYTQYYDTHATRFNNLHGYYGDDDQQPPLDPEKIPIIPSEYDDDDITSSRPHDLFSSSLTSTSATNRQKKPLQVATAKSAIVDPIEPCMKKSKPNSAQETTNACSSSRVHAIEDGKSRGQCSSDSGSVSGGCGSAAAAVAHLAVEAIDRVSSRQEPEEAEWKRNIFAKFPGPIIFTPIDKLIDQENGFEDINMEVSKKCAERQRKAVAQAIGPERLPETDVSYCETFGLIVEKADPWSSTEAAKQLYAALVQNGGFLIQVDSTRAPTCPLLKDVVTEHSAEWKRAFAKGGRFYIEPARHPPMSSCITRARAAQSPPTGPTMPPDWLPSRSPRTRAASDIC